MVVCMSLCVRVCAHVVILKIMTQLVTHWMQRRGRAITLQHFKLHVHVLVTSNATNWKGMRYALNHQ